MKNILFFLAILFAGMHIHAQKNYPEKYAETITAKDLKRNLTVIAGDEMQGRETGTEGQRRAAAYIENQFKKSGLKNPSGLAGFQQFYPLNEDSMVRSNLIIGNLKMQYGLDYYVQVSKCESKKTVANEIIFVGYGISHSNYDDYKDKDAKGKVVVFLLGEPKKDGKYLVSGTTSPSSYTYPGIDVKLKIAAEKGAVAAIIINQSAKAFSAKLVQANKKSKQYFISIPDTSSINSFILSQDMAKKILENCPVDSLLSLATMLKPMDELQLPVANTDFSFEYEKQIKVTNASNVIGVIEGSDKKDEYVFLTGHYDHLGMRDGKIYYGADDDGSGTCAVMEMAEAFAKAKADGNGPRRTVVCMTVSGEEKGLWGSEYYTDHPVFPLEKTSVDLNTDMVGRIDPNREIGDSMNYVYVIGHDKLSSDLPIINEGVNKLYTKLEFDYKYDDPNDPEKIFYRSDHYNFARKGVPVLFFFNGIHADYHKPSDTIDKINWSLYEKRVRMIFYTAWEIANREDMLKRDIPLPE